MVRPQHCHVLPFVHVCVCRCLCVPASEICIHIYSFWTYWFAVRRIWAHWCSLKTWAAENQLHLSAVSGARPISSTPRLCVPTAVWVYSRCLKTSDIASQHVQLLFQSRTNRFPPSLQSSIFIPMCWCKRARFAFCMNTNVLSLGILSNGRLIWPQSFPGTDFYLSPFPVMSQHRANWSGLARVNLPSLRHNASVLLRIYFFLSPSLLHVANKATFPADGKLSVYLELRGAWQSGLKKSPDRLTRCAHGSLGTADRLLCSFLHAKLLFANEGLTT